MTHSRLMLIQTAASVHCASPQHANRLLRAKDTGMPVIRATTLSGALRKQMRDALYPEYKQESDWKSLANADARIHGVFGSKEAPGPLQLSQGQLLFFPVRSLRGTFVWLSSPQLLTAFAQSLGESLALPDLKEFEARCAPDCPALNAGQHLLLEELSLEQKGDLTELMAWFQTHLADAPFLAEFPQRLVLVSDRVMKHFSDFALHSRARRNPESERLEHLEALPENTWLYSQISLAENQWEKLPALPPSLYLGSHKTLGYGLCSVSLYTAQATESMAQTSENAVKELV